MKYPIEWETKDKVICIAYEISSAFSHLTWLIKAGESFCWHTYLDRPELKDRMASSFHGDTQSNWLGSWKCVCFVHLCHANLGDSFLTCMCEGSRNGENFELIQRKPHTRVNQIKWDTRGFPNSYSHFLFVSANHLSLPIYFHIWCSVFSDPSLLFLPYISTYQNFMPIVFSIPMS